MKIIRPTIVVNVHTAHAVVVEAVREGRFVSIMRPSKWGNPFQIVTFRTKANPEFWARTRDEAIAKHANWLHTQPDLINAIPELVGKVLGCCCMPKRCHGEELVRLAQLVSLGC
jgi:hypothetical protein